LYDIERIYERIGSLQAACIGLVVITINPIITLEVTFVNVYFNVIADVLKVICQVVISFLTIWLMIIKIKNEKKNNKNEKDT
jgi:hypothetical protein